MIASEEDSALVRETFAERRRLVELLSGLTPQQWAAASLCEGWRVREVVAHITLAYRHSGPRVLAGIAAAGFRFNVFSDRIARGDCDRHSDVVLLNSLRDNVEHPWRPPGGGQRGALAHDVIHGLDITEALGLPPAPAERIAMAMKDAGRKQLKYFGVDLRGRSLTATDADLVIGTGQPIPLPAKDITLIVTGRREVPAD